MKRKRPEIGDTINLTGRVAEIHETPNGVSVAFLPEIDDENHCLTEDMPCKDFAPAENLGVSANIFTDGAAVVQAFIAVMQTPEGQAFLAALLKFISDFGIKPSSK